MSALRWVERPHAPPASHVRIHCPGGTAESPEEVVLLGSPVGLEVHYLMNDPERGTGSVPCMGAGCAMCQAGKRLLVNYFTPALLLTPQQRIRKSPVWERVVYYVPQGAAGGFNGGLRRSAWFAVWRHKKGSVDQLRSRLLGESQLAEAGFDVRPVFENKYFPTKDTRDALAALVSMLPVNVIPPQFNKAEENNSKPATEADLKKLKIAAGKIDPNQLDTVKDTIKFRGESIAQREANGTYNPGHNPGEGEGGGK